MSFSTLCLKLNCDNVIKTVKIKKEMLAKYLKTYITDYYKQIKNYINQTYIYYSLTAFYLLDFYFRSIVSRVLS